MATVTLIIQDIQSEEGLSVTISGDFHQPGKSYEEMTANPTLAVAMGLGLIAAAADGSDQFKGQMVDEFGATIDFLKPQTAKPRH